MRKQIGITLKELREIFLYDPETGLMMRRASPDKKVGRHCSAGYIRTSVRGIEYAVHRLAWMYMTGEWPDCDVDHINRIKDDNRWLNLRLASQSQNQANKSIMRGKQVMAKGVSFNRHGKYSAKIFCNGKRFHGGTFETVDEAAHAYNKLAIAHFGEFAILNPIGQDKEQTNVG